MTTEARLGNEGINPVQDARKAFNNALLAADYQQGLLLARTLQLQNALVRSELSPEKTFHELFVAAGQAADKAEGSSDGETALALRDLQHTFELTYDTFKPRPQEEIRRPSPPTRTEYLPPMIDPKGRQESSSSIPQKRGRSPKPTKRDNSSSQNETQNTEEETVGSFLRQKRRELGLTQTSLKGTNQFTVSRVENNAQKYSTVNNVKKIAEALNMSSEAIGYLMELYIRQYGEQK